MVVITIVLSQFLLMQMINRSLPPTREMLPESFGSFLGELMVFQNKACIGVLKCALGCLNENGCYPSCHIGEEFWW